MLDALGRRGWGISLCQIEDGFACPSQLTRSRAAAALHGIEDGSLVVVDGLAFGVLPDEALAEASRLRLVALVHHPLALETGLDRPLAARLFESERRALTAARHIVVTSPATARALADYGVNPTNVSVVRPGTDRAELAVGSNAGDVCLLCVASIVPRKGHALLLQALARLMDLPWRLTCGGSLDRDRATAQAVVAQVRAERLGHRVAFVGELSEPQLAQQYQKADVFVLPTLYEGYGMVVAEAIAHGLPSVASDTGGIAELLAGEAGIIVPPGDVDALTTALRRVIGEPDVRATLATGARKVREHLLSWEDAAAAMETVLLGIAVA
jgi:glycosyltransferase involved in cell wall biosynthesis